MEKHIFKIEDKNPLYKKLIKLPAEYYILNKNSKVIHSHIGTIKVEDINGLKLKKQGDKISLYEGNLPLQAERSDESGNSIKEDLIVEQEAIISTNRNNIIEKLESKPILISLYNIKDSPNFGLKLSGRDITGVLNFINFNDENDPVLQKIQEEKGGLYFTIEGDYIYISDEEGKCLPVCEDGSCYKYQYTKNEHDILEISEISTIIKNLTKTEQCSAPAKAEQNFTLQQGEKLSDNIYQADIMLNGKLVATLPKIGYCMLDDQLVIHNHVTEEEIKIPRDFHYLKVVKSSNNDDYKLTFCNFLGNKFFEHKKYDSQYSNVPNKYQYISLNCMKKEYKPDFCKLLNDKPSFFIVKGTTNQDSSGHCPADIFELTKSGKGKKMATLIDQFGSFNKEGKFQYCDYHTKADYDVYDSYKINKEYTATDEFLFNDDIVLYTIPELS
ncbi:MULTISPECIES: hypothetical protein [Wolbachia]|uniref:hypothetical protein n=1 Tax=Wolbachia TaxID=953 RepID=UPI00202216B7|nr:MULTISPECIES: hypothetical protein [unclassified Wolbachia]URG39995.1 hypothetical protein M1L25_001192 [Wolbachia endosymbiont of Ostrinia furnacalis]URG40979.1 hypothetical protein M1L26_001148 [Wolbachia endosymbiont of Ostrinia scapulalis]